MLRRASGEGQRESDETKCANALHRDPLLTSLLGPIELRDVKSERVLQDRGVRGRRNDRGVERRFPMRRGDRRTVEA